MIIYNKEWLLHLSIQQQAEAAFSKGDLDAEELKNIKDKFQVGFYSPNIFMRIGLFFLTLIILGLSMGLLSLLLYDLKVLDSPYYLFFLGLTSYLALLYMVKVKHHYQSGVDEALMWTAAGMFLFSAIYFLDKNFGTSLFHRAELCYTVILFFISTFLCLRFLDSLMVIVSFCALTAFAFFGWQEVGFYPLQTLPFLIMILSAVIYFYANLYEQRKSSLFYDNCIIAIKILSLLLFYLAGNYFVVRELGTEMSGAQIQNDQQIPFAWLFWLWTFIIPLLYIGFGLKKKNVILLRSGLLLVAAAAFTFRNYYHLVSTELLLVLAGIAAIGIAYFGIRYLKTPKNGYTAAEIDDQGMMDKINIESLIVAETFSTPQASPDPGSRMAGGNFGGGGSSGDF